MGIFEEEDLCKLFPPTGSVLLTRHVDYHGDLDKLYKHFTNIPNGTSPIDVSIDGGEQNLRLCGLVKY